MYNFIEKFIVIIIIAFVIFVMSEKHTNTETHTEQMKIMPVLRFTGKQRICAGNPNRAKERIGVNKLWTQYDNEHKDTKTACHFLNQTETGLKYKFIHFFFIPLTLMVCHRNWQICFFLSHSLSLSFWKRKIFGTQAVRMF